MILINIENKNLSVLFELFGEKIYVTETLVATWVVMAVLILIAVIVRILLKYFKDIPSGLQNVIEIVVETMNNLVKATMGEKFEWLGGYFFGIFAFIFFSNYSGIFGLKPPTSNLATTVALGLSTFVLIHLTGIYTRGGKYFKDYLHPIALFLPLNIIGELSRPLSLAFRLFGNILGGVVIMELVYSMLPTVLKFLLPDIAHAYFDLFAGALQAFIFTMLSMTFIQQKSVSE